MANASLQQSLSQQQALSPHLRQSLEILQANSLELSQILTQALELNPVLEDQTEHESLDELLDSENPDPDSLDDWQESYDDDLRDLAILERQNKTLSQDAAEAREHFYDSIVAPETLQEHLNQQLLLAGLSPKTLADCQVIVGNLTDHGYLDSPLESLAASLQIPLARLDDALAIVQSLDPIGIAAHDLRECLLLQLDHLGLGDSLEAAIVDEHLELVARNHLPQLAKKLSVTLPKVTAAVEHIRTLDPSPGSRFLTRSNPYVLPDVEIHRDEHHQWTATLTGSYLPKIRINSEYKELFANSAHDQKTHLYLRNQLREGRTVINAINQRQETILAIAREIIARQAPFLKNGPRHLRPMNMTEIAEAIGVHPTTISRAVAGKYLHTPHGLMEMRKFFNTGYQTQGGNDLSNQAVRQALLSLIENEDPKSPLADHTLQKLLAEQGIEIARRTVTKYREQLNLPPSPLRKKY